jgi:hypothetical protein
MRLSATNNGNDKTIVKCDDARMEEGVMCKPHQNQERFSRVMSAADPSTDQKPEDAYVIMYATCQKNNRFRAHASLAFGSFRTTACPPLPQL